VFNGERFIESCIMSIIDQNCSGVEHLIMDGTSTDSTMTIVRRFADKYPHIRWISERDEGQSDAMNKGIALAKGNLIGILNVDDYYEPNTLRTVVELFRKLPKPSLLVGNCNVWNDEGNLLYVSKPSKISLSNILLGRFMDSFPMNPAAYFYHASLHDIIGLYKTDEHYGMDLDFIIRAVQHAKVEYRDELWGNYRYLRGTKTHTDDMSGSNPKRIMAIVNGHLGKLPPRRRYPILMRRLLRSGFDLIKNLLRRTIGNNAHDA
jgi:glycosyltransferase involved in cell wall biosynthesis